MSKIRTGSSELRLMLQKQTSTKDRVHPKGIVTMCLQENFLPDEHNLKLKFERKREGKISVYSGYCGEQA